MRMLRSRHSRSSDSNLMKESRRTGRSEANYLPFQSFGLLGLAVLPLVVMLFVSIWNYIAEHPMISTKERLPYSFNWGEALELRSHLSAKYNQWPYLPNGLPRRYDMSIAEFRDMWDGKWPLIITDVVPSWAAFQWSKDFLYKFYSKSNLTVTQTKGSLKEASGDIMSLGDFYKLTFNDFSDASWAYATDEHFISNHPSLLQDIGANKYADEDYFSHFPEEIRPRSAMLLWGTKHSRSLLHVDPFNWTGTVALLKGTKRWKMWPPSPDNPLKLDARRSGFPLDCPTLVSSLDLFAKSPPPLVEGRGATDASQYKLEFDQKPGDLLFIPTGWAHQAYNVEETLAVSSQVMNRNNYRSVLETIISCTESGEQLPPSFSELGPEQQVSAVLSLIPPSTLEAARRTNNELRHRLMCGEGG